VKAVVFSPTGKAALVPTDSWDGKFVHHARAADLRKRHYRTDDKQDAYPTDIRSPRPSGWVHLGLPDRRGTRWKLISRALGNSVSTCPLLPPSSLKAAGRFLEVQTNYIAFFGVNSEDSLESGSPSCRFGNLCHLVNRRKAAARSDSIRGSKPRCRQGCQRYKARGSSPPVYPRFHLHNHRWDALQTAPI
jgi:hypothetical protein